MATFTSAAVAIPSFSGAARSSAVRTSSARLTAKASLKNLGLAVASTAAAATLLAGNALAVDVLLGGDDGSLAFIPNNFTISAGDKIVFKNNAGFPHNIVFDEDEIPSGVSATKISMPEEDLLNAPGETYAVTLTEKGEYSFYCAPHQGAGMVGKVTVN